MSATLRRSADATSVRSSRGVIHDSSCSRSAAASTLPSSSTTQRTATDASSTTSCWASAGGIPLPADRPRAVSASRRLPAARGPHRRCPATECVSPCRDRCAEGGTDFFLERHASSRRARLERPRDPFIELANLQLSHANRVHVTPLGVNLSGHYKSRPEGLVRLQAPHGRAFFRFFGAAPASRGSRSPSAPGTG